MHASIIASILAATAVAASGCATITRGTTETLVIQTEPEGASVELSSGLTCRTPCSLELKRKNDYRLYVRKAGYQDATLMVESRLAGSGAAGMAGNVLIGGIIGMGVDSVTGATNSLQPNPVHVHLVVLDPAGPVVACSSPGRAARTWNSCSGRRRTGPRRTGHGGTGTTPSSSTTRAGSRPRS
jgi:hypothetical protein